ncbi:MAG TPA: septum formation initiator family protein [Polyangiales bacterium]|nr:septum formation initiator family protein [Polyangiales bacterium]
MAWLLPFGLLVYALFSVPVRILSEDGLPRYRQQRELLARITQDNAQLSAEIARLDRESRALLYDPEAVERVARDELGMVRDGELLFQFDPQ